MKFNKKLILGLFLIVTLFLVGCGVDKISDIKSSDYVGKKVTVSGVVENTIKLGDLSGYTISDGDESIFVSSDALPKEGTNERVSGILMKNLLGYYIQTDN
ncbi:MAG: hypothetical protein AB7V77_03440 [Candidatus Woesearchaeota archaeon]